jgi:hypothetical protein
MIARVRAFGRFLYDFIFGDDPAIAIAVVLALGLTSLSGAWWVLPPAVIGVLTWSLLRATRL